ncbi:MAG TPA: O-antigen ligase family protein [Acidimicrobiales bacterium]|nr:O-antigen ligase family protein [Acidimicrobiales bacterium]
MSKLLLLGGGAVAAGMLVYLFVRWERAGREHWVVYLLYGILVTESALYSNQTGIPRSIWHPGSGSLQFRLPEVVITTALVARLLVKGRPTRIGLPGVLWLAVAGWWAAEAVEGVLRHTDTTQMTYEAKAIVYVMGAYALAAGIPIRRFLEGRGLQRLVRWSGLAAAALIVTDFAKINLNVNVPIVAPQDSVGVMGTDAATIFVVIGMVGLLVELAKEHRDARTMVCLVPLLFSPFFAFQRAVLLSLGAMVALVVVVALGSTARARLRVRAGEVAVVALAVVGVVLAVSVVPALTSQNGADNPLASTVSKTVGNTFDNEAKAESAQSRITKWSIAWHDAAQSPILGQGLGFEYTYYAAGNGFVTTDLTENIFLDLWLRTGIIGVLLFLAALVVSLANGFAIWRLHPDRTVAVLALALLAAVVGLIAAGQVESVFENYRLATVLGLSLGMLRAAVTSAGGSTSVMRSYHQLRQYEVV